MLNIVFDYDGTLFNSIDVFAPVFRKAYYDATLKGLFPKRTWTDEKISRWMGHNSLTMRKEIAAHLSDTQWEEFTTGIKIAAAEMADWSKGRFFPGVVEVLRTFKERGYRLFILSNCSNEYICIQRNLFDLDRYFTAYFCSGDYGWAPKKDILKLIKKEYSGQFIMVGDRLQDMEAANAQHILAIGCAYGYGDKDELNNADILIYQPMELLTVIPKVLKY
ncbi:MAG: HAD family hydrolase [Succiniclasticum sp.]|nr:HAD family hydrolase [Succiniclasticum sp.]